MGHWPGQGNIVGQEGRRWKKTQKGTEPFSMRKLMSTKMLQKHLKLFTTGESSWENPVKKKTTEATTTTTAAVAARIYAISPRAQLGHSCHAFHASPRCPPSQHPQCWRPCALPLASSAMHFNA